MAHDPHTIRTIGRWLADLVDMTKQGREPLTDRKIALYTEQLADMFPAGAFTKGSLRAVCFEEEYFPAFDTVRARVRQWWHENMPASAPLIAFEGGPKLDANDHSWMAYYYRRRPQLTMANAGQQQIDSLESLIKQQSPRAWESISGVREATPAEPTEAEKEAVAAAVRRVVGRAA